MKKSFLFAFLLFAFTVNAQNCPAGYEEKNVKCGTSIVAKCVPINYNSKDAWMVYSPPCNNSKSQSGGRWYYNSYDLALQGAERHKAENNSCPFYNDQIYTIYLDDSKLCNNTIDWNEAKKNDFINKIKPFLQRYKAEIANYRRYFNGQPYKPGAVFKEYEEQLKQAEENVSNLEMMLNNINDNNLSLIENTFNNMQQEEQNLKQADTNFKNELNSTRQEEISKQQSDEVKEQQLEQQRKTQEKIDVQMKELSEKSQSQANYISGVMDGLSGIASSIQIRDANKSISEENERKRDEFKKLKEEINTGDGELKDCNSCFGNGYKDCNSCNNSGYRGCSSCQGQGGSECLVCHGNGKINYGNFSMACTACLGKGTKNCAWCNNSGKTICGNCHGTLKSFCNKCNGTGKLFKKNVESEMSNYSNDNNIYQNEKTTSNINIATPKNILLSSSGIISLYAKTSMQDIEATSTKVVSAINTNSLIIFFKLKNTSFHFKSSLMEDEFTKKYMESTQYPYSEFKGKIISPMNIDLKKDGIYDVIVEGNLLMHGISKKYVCKGTITVKDNSIRAQAKFKIVFSDHNIRNVSLGDNLLASEIEVALDSTMGASN